jgi:diguanylate cyclase (GGDEF)-like protein
LLISLTLALAGGALTVFRGSPVAHIDLGIVPLVLAVVVGVLFAGGEMALMNIEFRRQAYSFTLAGVPLALGVLILPTPHFVLARIAGSAVALLWQRIQPVKITYNLCAYGFEAALAGAAAQWLITPHNHPDLAAAGLVVAIIVTGDALMTVLVLNLIRIHSGPVPVREAIGILTQAALVSLSSSIAAMVMLLMLTEGVLGIALVALLAAAVFLAYRSYAGMTHRHRSLAVVHDFVTSETGTESVDAVARPLLDSIRSLLRAESVELLLVDEAGGSGPLTLAVREDAQRTSPMPLALGDWLITRARQQSEAIVVSRQTKDPGLRRWLDEHGLRDALIVPIRLTAITDGLLVVSDRLGETSTFTDDDLRLVQTLTGHLAATLRTARLVERLGYEASHDSLTGLANRAALSERIHQRLVADEDEFAVLLLDLDSFKEVNDAFGHHIGDALLVDVAHRLQSCLPAAATIARLGGDEFAVLLPEPSDEDGPMVTARAVLAALAAPVTFDDASLTPAASIGIAVRSGSSGDADLLRQADTAMYAAKTAGTALAAYTPDLDRGRAERLALLADLRCTLDQDRDQLVLYYQPKVSLATGRVTGVEALVRWNHPTLGLLGPSAFVPLAESAGLVTRLTPHVIERALRECRVWLDRGHDITVAVNVSAHNLDADFPTFIRACLAANDVPARNLVVEITESSIMGEMRKVEPVLRELSEVGVALSLDDFGTGYSSLAYLQRLPVHEIKIDQSFVRGLDDEDSANSATLIRSIAGLGANLGLRVVAEGVEYAETMDALRDLGADVVQGYYISRPIPPDQLIGWLNHHRLSTAPMALASA